MPSPSKRVEVAGVPVDLVAEQDVLREAHGRLGTQSSFHIVTVNAEFVVRARRDAEFRRVLQCADLATADGAGILWALRRKGHHLTHRVGGSDLIWSLCDLAARSGSRVFFVGAAPGVAATVAYRMRACFPKLSVAGALSGSPARDAEPHIVDLIRRSQTDILFVAFGAPAQEIWIARNLPRTGATVAIGVGGSFDYVAGVAMRAPAWMRRSGLDWLWRLARQPRRWRRMLALPRFAWMVLNEARAEDTRQPERA